MGGKILAINEGFGYRPIIVVKNFNFLPQFNERPPTTYVYGDQLMFLYDNPTGYVSFLRPMIGQTLRWDQLGLNEDETAEQIFAIFPKMPIRVVMEEPLVLLSAGKDPIAGYYVQFAGPMRLFSQHEWWRDGVQYEE